MCAHHTTHVRPTCTGFVWTARSSFAQDKLAKALLAKDLRDAESQAASPDGQTVAACVALREALDKGLTRVRASLLDKTHIVRTCHMQACARTFHLTVSAKCSEHGHGRRTTCVHAGTTREGCTAAVSCACKLPCCFMCGARACIPTYSRRRRSTSRTEQPRRRRTTMQTSLPSQGTR